MSSRVLLLVAGFWLGAVAAGVAQVVDPGEDHPRYFMATKAGKPPVDASDAPVLRRRVTATLNHVRLGDALQDVGRQAGVRFAVSPDVVPVDARVSLRVNGITLGAALYELLSGRGLDVHFSAGGRGAAIVRRGAALAANAASVGGVAGRVTDAKTGAALPRAEVTLDHTRWRTMSDTAGRYKLADVEVGSYTLTVRRLGYGKQTRTVTVQEGRTDTMDVALEPVATRLNELVSTATGQRQRLQIPSDVTVLNADSLMRTQPVRSVTDLLDGRVPGLTVQRTSGAPGDPARLRLHGTSSPLRSNDPIVFVDNVRFYAEQSAARSANLAGGGFAAPSPLDYIDPNTIETIEIVKGASAATLYGEDAANGVILITTKKGKVGPTRWNMSAEHGVTNMVARYPEQILRWGHDADGVPNPCPLGDYTPYRLPCVADSVVRFQLLNDPDFTPIDRGHRTAASLGVSGGVQGLTYSVIGSYSYELGMPRLPQYEVDRFQERVGQAPPDWMLRPQSFTRWGVMTSFGAQLGAKANLTLQTNLSQTNQQRSTLENEFGEFSGTYLDRVSGQYYRPDIAGSYYLSPATGLGGYYTKVTANALALTTAADLVWHPRSWLTTSATAGLTVQQRGDRLFLPRGASPYIDSVGALADGRGRTLEPSVTLRATATRPLGGKFTLRFTTRADYVVTSIKDLATTTTWVPLGQEVPGDTTGRVSQNAETRTQLGWAVEPALEYGHFNLLPGLAFSSGGSYGGSIRVPAFPKLGGSWLMSDESFFPFKDVISSFRVRASYGRASRQPGMGDRLRLYNATTYRTVNGQSVLTTGLNTLGNSKLRPEQSSEFQGGFDADLFDSRLSLTLTGFRKTTDDALMSVPLPPSVGPLIEFNVPTVLRNIGKTRNTGLDLELSATPVRSGPVNWTTRVIMSHRRDEVVRLGPGVQPFYVGGGQRIAAGYPLNGFWAQPVAGYADANGDGVITVGEVSLGDTAVYRGAPLPDYEATLSNSIQLWRGALQLTADITCVQGLTQHLADELVGKRVVFYPGRNDPASPPSEQAAAASTFLTSYFSYQQVSTTRFNAVAVNYTVPAAFARRLGAERLTVSLQGSNLGLWSNYRGADPNVNGYATGNLLVDGGQLPQPRTWQVQIHATY